MPLNIQLIVIDPQRDFCDPSRALYVPGAERDMERLAAMVDRLRGRLSDIHVTLDSHRKVDISHPIWWCNEAGKSLAPFTTVSAADMRSGVWSTTRPAAYQGTLDYLEALESGGRYPHVVWPYHCLIGEEGHNVMPVLAQSIHEWEDQFAMADFVTKGSNPWTEHFSAVQAEVPDPADQGTQLNAALIRTLGQADITLWAGEALSHCLANSVREVVNQFATPETIEKTVLLTDATGNVPGFENYGDDFLAELRGRGMKMTTTAEFMAA